MNRGLKRLRKKAKTLMWRLAGFLFSGKKRLSGAGIELGRVRSVLVVRPDRLGDVILSTPVYRSIKQSLPEAQVSALVDPIGGSILKDDPNVDRVIEWNHRKPWRTLRQLSRYQFDLAFNLNKMFSATFSLLTRVSGAACRVGYDHPENAWVHHVRVPPGDESRHEIQNNLELLKAAGLSKTSDRPGIYFNEEEKTKVETLIRENKTHPDLPLILIKPGTRIAEWGWSLKNFAALTRQIMESVSPNVFIITGPGEESMIDDFTAGLNPRPFCLPKLSIKELGLMIKHSDLLVCNHTGIMHLASATGTPVAAIFKHGNVKRWGPCHTRHAILEERGNDHLSPETVLQAIEQLLKVENIQTA